MSEPQVTIIVVPRERFSHTERTLNNIYEHTTIPFNLVYVSGKSPARIQQYLELESQRRGFRLIPAAGYLAPNQARNLGIREAHTKYTVFLDNDALVSPGWLEALVLHVRKKPVPGWSDLFILLENSRSRLSTWRGLPSTSRTVMASGCFMRSSITWIRR